MDGEDLYFHAFLGRGRFSGKLVDLIDEDFGQLTIRGISSPFYDLDQLVRDSQIIIPLNQSEENMVGDPHGVLNYPSEEGIVMYTSLFCQGGGDPNFDTQTMLSTTRNPLNGSFAVSPIPLDFRSPRPFPISKSGKLYTIPIGLNSKIWLSYSSEMEVL